MSTKDHEKALSTSSSSERDSQMLEVRDEKASDQPLPSPVTAPSPPRTKPKLSAAAIIPIWIVLSSSVIIYNNYVYNTLNFRFPVFMVTWHLTFAVSNSARIYACARMRSFLRRFISYGHIRPWRGLCLWSTL